MTSELPSPEDVQKIIMMLVDQAKVTHPNLMMAVDMSITTSEGAERGVGLFLGVSSDPRAIEGIVYFFNYAERDFLLSVLTESKRLDAVTPGRSFEE